MSDAYAECYPAFHDFGTTVVDSDEEDMSHMDKKMVRLWTFSINQCLPVLMGHEAHGQEDGAPLSWEQRLRPYVIASLSERRGRRAARGGSAALRILHLCAAAVSRQGSNCGDVRQGSGGACRCVVAECTAACTCADAHAARPRRRRARSRAPTLRQRRSGRRTRGSRRRCPRCDVSQVRRRVTGQETLGRGEVEV